MSITNTRRISGRAGVERGRWWALGALVLSGLVLGLDATILVTALPTISSRLGASTSDLQWISAAYTLALGGLLLPAGVLGDHFGRRRLLLVGLLIFGVSSVVASQMTTATGLIWMRALMGVGGAIIMPLSLSILPTMFTPEERPRAVALTAVGAMLGLPLGPLAAGWLLNNFDWGSIFLINAPVVLVALLGVWFLVPESKDPGAPRLDWIGAVLVVAGVTALVYGVIEQPVDGWGDPHVLGGLIGGGVVLAIFVVEELRASTPLIDLGLFLRPRFAWATVAFVVVGASMFGVLFVLAPYLQIVQGNDAQGTGIRMIPIILAMLVAAVMSDRLSAQLGGKVVIAGGLLVSAAGLVLLSRVGADSGYTPVAIAMAVMGLGLGLAMPVALDAILGALPQSQTGTGSALTRAVQQIAASLGVAILGSILSGSYQHHLAGHLSGLGAPVQDAARGSVAGAVAVAQHLPAPVAGALVQAARDAYTTAMDQVLLVCAGMVIAGTLLVALFLPSRPAATEPVDVIDGEAS